MSTIMALNSDSQLASDDEKLDSAGRDRGFTIIEVLVVMAIITLLATIAIPVFSTIKINAYDAAAQSDLRQAAIMTESYITSTGIYPTSRVAWNNAILYQMRITNLYYEGIYYTPGSSGAGYTIFNYDIRSFNNYCYQSAGGGITKVANLAVCSGFASSN